MYKKEADALKRKDQARTMAMQAQNLNAKSGAKSLKDQLAEAEEKIHSIQHELKLQTLKQLELEQAKAELEQQLAAEQKVLKRTEEKCGSLEEQLLQERSKNIAHSRDKLGSGDGTTRSTSNSGTVKVVSGKVADVRQKEKSIKDLTAKLQEMDKQFSVMNAKVLRMHPLLAHACADACLMPRTAGNTRISSDVCVCVRVHGGLNRLCC